MTTVDQAQKNMRILVVDDNESIHNDYRKILDTQRSGADLDELEMELFGSNAAVETQDDFTIESAFQGEEALKKVCAALASGQPYAMAFVDMRMPPGWDGLRTIREIWAKDPELLVVICTAYSDYTWEELREQLGYTDRLLILKKPFDAAEVYQLAVALTEKWHLARTANMRLEQLEGMVETRTAELVSTQRALTAAVERLKDLATTDGLTGLKNHRAFQDHWAAEWEAARRTGLPVSVLMMDIDDFKAYNDSYGHPAGDDVLRMVAVILSETCRDGDFLARYGGEEFVMVLPATDTERADAVAERVRTAIAMRPWPVRPVTASIGVSTLKGPIRSAIDIIAEADQALYLSKKRGRNRVTHWSPGMRPEAVVALR
jgi:diguanylate cyclase (GGDEF)-like protein